MAEESQPTTPSPDGDAPHRRVLLGRVVSDKMQKTVTVAVTRLVKHAKYGRYMKQTRKYKAHDQSGDCKIDDMVLIEESRPLSKTKRWVVIERRPKQGPRHDAQPKAG